MESYSNEMIAARDTQFTQRINMVGVRNLGRCFQCCACSDGCPVSFAMDYYPNQIIYMVRLGLKENVLQSKTIWICASCETCATHCPNHIDIVRLMDELRKTSFQEGVKSGAPNISNFHKTFITEIKKRGRIHELSLLLRYKLKTKDLFSLKKIREDAYLGIKLVQKGKLKLWAPKMKNKGDVKKIFKEVFAKKRAQKEVLE